MSHIGSTYKPEPVVNITYFAEYRVSNVTHWINIQTLTSG